VELVNLGPMPGYQPVEPRPPVQAEPVPEEPPKPLKVIKIAIFKFEFFQANGHGGNLGQMVAQVLTTEAANSGAFRLAERELLDKVMKEHELGQSGLMEDNEAREIGRMVGADAILTGAVSKLGRDMRIDARLIDVETGNVIAAAGRDTTSDLRGISKACGDLMRDLVSRLSEV
jgi:TolB-like protein